MNRGVCTCCWTARKCLFLLGIFRACAEASVVEILEGYRVEARTLQRSGLESFAQPPNIDFFTSRTPVEARGSGGISENENFAHGFQENQLVIPIRLHHVTGHPVHHGRHFRNRRKEDERTLRKRLRRELRFVRKTSAQNNDLRESANPSSRADETNRTLTDVIPQEFSGDDEESGEDYVDENEMHLDHKFANFSVTAFGEEFRLHLTPYDEFLAPNYTLHYMGDAEKEGFRGAEWDVPRHCFYSGHVNGRPDHRAVLSVCRGLFGAFRVGETDYLIQPEENRSFSHPDQHDADEEGTKPHRIFKRSNRLAGSNGRKLCAVTDSSVLREAGDSARGASGRVGRETFDDDILHRLRQLAASARLTDFADRRRRFEIVRRLRDRNTSRVRHRLAAMATREKAASRVLVKQALTRLALGTRTIGEASFHPKTNVTASSHADDVMDDDATRSRKKRYVSLARNVEVMVTADNEMLKAHDDVEHYVLTLMAIVNHVYHDPSIENMINIVLVKLIVIGDSQVHNGPDVARNAHTCLRNFCQWQFTQNDPDDSHPNHHDTAVLITGKDICRSNAACDTLGLAELGTMCDMKRSCSINEDNGLSTAFTIAHEIGHEFNAPHDNNDKCLDARGRTVSLNVMSPTLDHNAHPWSWSKCSAKYITSFLDNGNGKCLLDEPPQRVLPLPIEEPGEMFDANQQCSFVYGKGVTHCNFMFQNTCARLWCVSQNISHGCRTPHVPWADGTRCGDRSKRMWCQQGKCVPENRDRVPVDGSWGEWGRFGECSRSCGGGIKSATRTCDNPKPQYGGRYCTGKRKKFRPCNPQECPEGRDFRAEQCSAYNNWSRLHKHRIRGLAPNAEWVPKYDGILMQDRCKLICQVRSENQYAVPWYVLKPKVINGTPCGPDTHDICVEGVCKKAGCDHVLNSRATEDRCGVCNGDNTGCRTVQGSYNAGYNFGYNQVVVIPSGASSVVITQTSYTSNADDFNYLALRDAHGNYILNGNRSVMKAKHRIHKRSREHLSSYVYFCDYSGTDNVVETINCSKAIQTDIIVEVLSAGELMPPNIRYSYSVPNGDKLTYRWDPNGPWSPCSRPCEGKTKAKILCVRSDQQVVSERHCLRHPKPTSVIRSCNTKCQLGWHPKPGECSVRCGNGRTKLDFECRKVPTVSRNDRGDYSTSQEVETVSDNLCSQPKPGGLTACRGECLPTRWVYGEWTKCSASCGGGIQTRTAVCKDTKNRVFDESECERNEREVTRACADDVACPDWVASSFTPCMVTCGTGIRQRRVWCGVGKVVRPNTECSARSRPATTEICREGPCARWRDDGWSPCSATCGSGVATRLYRCVGPSGRSLDKDECSRSSLPKEQTRHCAASRRCFSGYHRSYSEGQHPSMVFRALNERETTRYPTATTDSTATSSSSAPTTTKTSTAISSVLLRSGLRYDGGGSFVVVNRRRERAQWRTGSWTQCSATCGPGVRERYVSCRHNRGYAEAEDAACGPPESKPVSREACEAQPCRGEWRAGSWSECTASCGRGTRTRHVRCAYGGRYHDDGAHCQHAPRPRSAEDCGVAPCPTAATANTPSTTVTTTISLIAERNSKEQSPIYNDVIRLRNSDDALDGHTSLVIRGRLHESDLAREKRYNGAWRTGRWSRCTRSCGTGEQHRVVVCLSATGEKATCDDASRPAGVKSCNGEKCPRWRHSHWSKCSRSCHGGTRTRSVYCFTANNQRTYDHHCDVTKRPTRIDACNLKSCPPDHRWRKSAWSSCSKSCGRGTKTRAIVCVNSSGESVSHEFCLSSHAKKPRTVKKCRLQRRCPRWRTKRWGECSVTCGPGLKRRQVRCRYRKKTLPESSCSASARPADVTRCNVTACASYLWTVARWSSCSRTCGAGTRTRPVTCRRLSGNIVADPAHCSPTSRPATTEQCNNGHCSARWETGAWSECSRSCGPGMQRREVTCSYIDPITYEVKEAQSCDKATKPYGVRDCNHGSCRSHVHWRVGQWEECSATCGYGISVRRVACTERATQAPLDDAVCNAMPSFRPERTRRCRVAVCIPASCRQLQLQQGVTTDGEYSLKIKDKLAKIYCKNMASSRPLEYVSLATGYDENFSEIYGYRLVDADTCPFNGSRDDSCECHRDNPDAGKTSFRKVRIDVGSMRVLLNDFSFATTSYGKAVPFGVAGDCYSRANCPQGAFRINLEGTGFVVDPATRWRSYGVQSVRRTHRSHSGDVVSGVCGGYCSRCQPDPSHGLLLSHDT